MEIAEYHMRPIDIAVKSGKLYPFSHEKDGIILIQGIEGSKLLISPLAPDHICLRDIA